jgi:DNA invertase Pin-like site-specific DNA recombinase
LSLNKRTKITNILNKTKGKDIQKICVESARAISRDANVAEEMYQKAREAGVQIVPADIPDLCALQPNPVQIFIRRMMFAMTELEKNLNVQRLRDGQQKKTEQA